MTLPSGTVTFLFTDIEGSTRLWEQSPEAMRTALARHDQLMRQAIETNNGVVFKTIGDAFCAAFVEATDALAAALSAQCALQAEPWPPEISVRARMALHTGEVEQRDNDYFGQPLNRVARLVGVGHGGQVLVSKATQERIHESLPPSASLRNLGAHRLKDLGNPHTVFQLLHPDLPSEFPPLRSLNSVQLPNNLPQQVTSFIGRTKEIEAVKFLLAGSPLVTLAGHGGAGKSRLSLQVAAEALENYPDGAWFVELAPLTDPPLVFQSVASTLGIGEEPGKPLLQTLTAALKSKTLLLLLDNCEHLLAACAQLADAVIRACPRIRILASSREGLGIAGETVYRLPALSLPDRKQSATVESLRAYDTVHLFVDRAKAVAPAFAVTEANAAAVASICRQLDGIPLAIELAAARVRSLTVEEIDARLDDGFRLLAGGSRTALPRQQTLRALMDWSYDLLNEQERALLGRLAVFAGGWTLAAAETVGSLEGVEEWEVLDLLTSLVDKSLVVAETQEEQTRYRLLETLRRYAKERLAERGEESAVQARHQAFFAALAEDAEPKLAGSEQAACLRRLEREHDNLRAALEGGDPEAALRIAAALWRFWLFRGYYSEGREWLKGVLTAADRQARTPTQAKALSGAGALAWAQGDFAASHALVEESLALRRELGDKQGIAASLNNLGLISSNQGDYKTAQTLFAESLALERELGNRQGIAYSLNNLGNMARNQGDYETARALYAESLVLQRELKDKLGIANALLNLGNIPHSQGDYAAARALYEESLALRRELGDKSGIAGSLNNLGLVAEAQNDGPTARNLHAESLGLYHELGDRRGIASSLQALAALTALQEPATRAPRLWGAAEALREEVGAPLAASERPGYDRQIEQARSKSDPEAFALAWSQGRSMTIEQAIQYALEEPA